MENRTNRDKSMADFDNNHELNQASSSSRAVNYSSGAANSADKPTAKPAECRTNSLDKIKCRTNRADKPTAKPAEGRTNSADKLECRTNCAEKPTAKPAECRTNSADKQECRTNFPDIATAENCPSNDSNMIWHLGSLCSQRPSEVEMRARNLASSYQNVQNLVLQRRLSFDLQRMEMNSLSIPELRRCLSGPSRQSGLSTDAMPPLPNNSVESSPRPQIAIESLPKQRSSVPATSNNNNNSSTNLLNNSSTNLLNNSNMLTTFETSATEPATGHYSGSVQYANHNGHFGDTIQYANHNGFSDHGSTSNGVHEAIDTSNFNREIERLKTFEGWRVPFLSSAQMAAAGFYYTKKDDIVRCAFCGVEVGSWVEGDNPMLDHQRWSPACRFMRKLPVGNVPLTAGDLTAAGLSRTSSEGYDTCGSTTRQYGIVLRQSASAGCGGGSSGSPLNNMRAIEELGIQQMRPPAYPAYSSFESRLASYAMWPISLKLKPNVLSEAGFYYTGKGDQTICYYCGGGLKDWEESDVPWEEHGKWFSRCNFVLSIKGKEFVDKVCNKKPEQDETGVRSETTVSDLEAESSEPRNESEASTLATTSTLSSATEQSTASVSATENGTTSSAANSVESAANPAATADSRLCKICYMEEMGILFLPCGHIVACPKCALLLTTCAVCRKPYSATVRAFLS